MSLHDAVFTIRRGSLNLQNNKVMAREGGWECLIIPSTSKLTSPVP
jgi:hypothetical protein